MGIQGLKWAVRAVVPEGAIELRRRFNRYLRTLRDKNLSSAQVFTEIYQNNLWGGARGDFCSGEGSSLSANAIYCAYVKEFIKDNNIKTVLDIGCGDFQVSRNIVGPDVNYIGVDVVAPLVERNQREFADEHISFECLDVVKDDLPRADLILIREVLQHLSNEQIAAILAKTRNYPCVIITEYQPAAKHLEQPNIDKPHGMDTRIWNNSGVYLEYPPFFMENANIVLEIPIEKYLVREGEQLVSYLLQNPVKRQTV